MNIQYFCELYFNKDKNEPQVLVEQALQNLGFIPGVMSIYIDVNEMFEEISYDEDLLLGKLSKGEIIGITINEHIYDENVVNRWFRLGKTEGDYFSLLWSNENMDFIVNKIDSHFSKVEGFTAGYIFDNNDVWHQSNQAKENINSTYLDYPGQFKFVNGLQFMAAPLMWFGEPFFKIISKDRLMRFEEAEELSLNVIKVKLFNIYKSAQDAEHRRTQRNFCSIVELDKVVAKFDQENAIDTIQSLNDFLANLKSSK